MDQQDVIMSDRQKGPNLGDHGQHQEMSNHETQTKLPPPYLELKIPWTEEQLAGLCCQLRAMHDNVFIAGPGSGKTTELIELLIRLLSEGVDPQSILALAFNNSAVKEIRKRLKRRLEMTDVKYIPKYKWYAIMDAPMIGTTIHKFAKTIARDHGLIPLNASHHYNVNEFQVILRNFVQTNPHILFQYRFAFIDEFQDVCDKQFGIVQAIRMNPESSVTVIGDPDQNLYKWRSTDSKYLNDFHTMSPMEGRTTSVYFLSVNNRSNQPIVDVCQAILDRNHSKDAVPYTNRLRSYQTMPGYKGPVHTHKPKLIILDNNFKSIEWIRKQVQSYVAKGHRLKDIAVLSRSNNLLFRIEERLQKMGIPTYLAKDQSEGYGERDSNEDSQNAVYLGTIHQAKGKEWPFIIGIGYHTDYFPDRREIEVESERNLHFVLCSRAQHELTLIMGADKPSLLIVELPLSLFDVTGLREAHDRVIQDRLSALKMKQRSERDQMGRMVGLAPGQQRTLWSFNGQLSLNGLSKVSDVNPNANVLNKSSQVNDNFENQELVNYEDYPREWYDMVCSELIAFKEDDERKQKHSWYVGVSDLIQNLKGESYLELKNRNFLDAAFFEYLFSIPKHHDFLTNKPWAASIHPQIVQKSQLDVSSTYPLWVMEKHLESEMGRYMDILGRFMIWEFSSAYCTGQSSSNSLQIKFTDKHSERCLFGDEKEKRRMPRDDVLRTQIFKAYKTLQESGKCWRNVLLELWTCSWCATFEKGRTAIAYNQKVGLAELRQCSAIYDKLAINMAHFVQSQTRPACTAQTLRWTMSQEASKQRIHSLILRRFPRYPIEQLLLPQLVGELDLLGDEVIVDFKNFTVNTNCLPVEYLLQLLIYVHLIHFGDRDTRWNTNTYVPQIKAICVYNIIGDKWFHIPLNDFTGQHSLRLVEFLIEQYFRNWILDRT